MREPPAIHPVADRLGIHRAGARRLSPCPSCRRDERRHGPITTDGKLWRCHGCTAGGSAFDLVSYALFGEPARERFKEVLAWLDGCDVATVTPAEESEPLGRVPSRDLLAALRAAVPPAEHPAARAFLERRGIPVENCPAGVLPPSFRRPWWPHRHHPLIVPMFTGRGELASIHGRAIDRAAEAAHGKTRWPKGAAAGGCLFADPAVARPFLRGANSRPETVLIVEGLTDYLAAATRFPGVGVGVLGIESGSADALRLHRWEGVRVLCWVDRDHAGESYDRAIAAAIAPTPVFSLSREAA